MRMQFNKFLMPFRHAIPKDSETIWIKDSNLLNNLLNFSSDLVYFKDRESRFVRINHTLALHLGLGSSDDAAGRTDADFFSEEHALQTYLDEQHVMATGEALVAKEERETWADGRMTWVSSSKSAMRDEAGNIIGIIGISRDITARKQIEEALERSNSLLNAALESTADGILVVDIEGRVASCNRKFLELWRIPVTMVGNQDDDTLVQFVMDQLEDPAAFLAKVEELYRQPRQSSWDELKFRDGRIFERYSQPQCVGNIIVGRVWSFRDVTSQKQAEKSLRESQAKLEAALASMTDAVFISDATGRFVEFNDAFATFHRFKNKADCTDRLSDYPEILEVFMPNGELVLLDMWAVPRALRGETVSNAEYTLRRKDTGETWDGSYSFSPLRDRDGVVSGSVVVARDITSRKSAESELRKLSLAVEQSPAVVMVTNTAGIIDYVNPKFSEVTGYSSEEVIGKNPRILKSGKTPPDAYRTLWETITAGKTWQGELLNRKKNGQLFWEIASISPITDNSGVVTHFIAVKEDITERKQLQEQVLRSQRMESIGTLAGGIAHDLNNILAPIVMASHLMSTDSGEERKLIESVQESAKRAADLVKQLLSFARGVEGSRMELDARHLIKETEKIVLETFPKNIRIIFKVPADIWRLLADPTQVQQILMNLCVNARDAMPAGGTLTLEVRNLQIDDQFASGNLAARPGPHLLITVTDTGTGIAPEIRERIFDPFFTTKQVGQGTGLGLSTTLGIVKSHGGFIDVRSGIGKGTAFNIYMPALGAAPPVVEEKTAADPPMRGHGELILLVDDEPGVLSLARRSLEKFGYRVITATDGKDAVGKFVHNQFEVALVVTDIMMPVMDGVAAIQALLRIKPGLKIIATTGLAVESQMTAATDAGAQHFLPKPYTPKAMLDAIRQALDT